MSGSASADSPVWLITGVSSGLGLSLALAVLSAGHRVIGTVRSRSSPRTSGAVTTLTGRGATIIELDMDAPASSLAFAATSALSSFGGRLDVLVNNAAFAAIGPVEDISDAAAKQQFSTNFFGPLALIRALLPVLRARGASIGAAIVNVSSVAGFDGLPSSAMYAASKFALEGLSEGLAREVGPLGVATLIVEPGAFRTNFIAAMNMYGGAGGKAGNTADDAVAELSAPYLGGPAEQTMRKLQSIGGKQIGDPDKAGKVIVDQVVKAIAVGKENVDVKRVLLGSDAVGRLQYKLGQLHRDLEAGEKLARTTDFEAPK